MLLLTLYYIGHTTLATQEILFILISLSPFLFIALSCFKEAVKSYTVGGGMVAPNCDPTTTQEVEAGRSGVQVWAT